MSAGTPPAALRRAPSAPRQDHELTVVHACGHGHEQQHHIIEEGLHGSVGQLSYWGHTLPRAPLRMGMCLASLRPGPPGVCGGLVAPSPTPGSLRRPDRSAVVPLGKALQDPSRRVVDTHKNPTRPHTQLSRPQQKCKGLQVDALKERGHSQQLPVPIYSHNTQLSARKPTTPPPHTHPRQSPRDGPPPFTGRWAGGWRRPRAWACAPGCSSTLGAACCRASTAASGTTPR